MVLNDEQWKGVMNYFRSKLLHQLDLSHFVENTRWREELQMPHKGFYVGIVSSSGANLLQEGFLSENLTNVITSVDDVRQIFGGQ